MATPADWLREAEEDLSTARALLARPVPKHACFFAQQAAEKALKAVLLHHAGRIPKSHDLPDLHAQARQADPSFSDHLAAAQSLTKFYSLLRYPDIRPPGWTSPSLSEAEEAVRQAKGIVQDVRSLIAPSGPQLTGTSGSG